MEKPVLVIMAAGLGSRYGGLKQAEKITKEGDMLIDFALFNAKRAGFDKAVLIIQEEHREIFSALVDRRAGKHMQIEYVYQKMDDLPENGFIPIERKKPWGTAHAIYACRNIIKGSFAVINADDYYGPESFRLAYEACLRHEASLIGYKLINTVTENGGVTRGVCQERDGFLSEIVEQKNIEIRNGKTGVFLGGAWKEIPGDTSVSMNFWTFPREWVDGLSERFEQFFERDMPKNPEGAEFLIPEVVGNMLNRENYIVKVYPCSEKWCGVTYKEDKQWVEETIASMKENGEYPLLLWD